jgi:predicted  nucleic acid-binding Zn-ribbon protein
MALSIGSGARSVTNSVGAQSQILRIMAQIKGVRKQLASMQKQLRETSDPELQKLLFKQIFDLQRTIQLMEQQIAQIEAAEQQKAAARQHDKDQPSDQEKPGQ